MKREISTFLKSFRTKPDGYIGDIFNYEEVKSIPDKKGVYVLVSKTQRFIYPNGNSKIIYIGKANSLLKRLKTHYRHSIELRNSSNNSKNSQWFYSRYQYIDKFDCQVYWYTTRGQQDPKDLESIIIEHFYNKYLSLPIGNGAFSFKQKKITNII